MHLKNSWIRVLGYKKPAFPCQRYKQFSAHAERTGRPHTFQILQLNKFEKCEWTSKAKILEIILFKGNYVYSRHTKGFWRKPAVLLNFMSQSFFILNSYIKHQQPVYANEKLYPNVKQENAHRHIWLWQTKHIFCIPP